MDSSLVFFAISFINKPFKAIYYFILTDHAKKSNFLVFSAKFEQKTPSVGPFWG